MADAQDQGTVTSKVEFRLRQDREQVPWPQAVPLPAFRWVWMAGFKACLDFLIIELRAVEQHQAADILAEVRKQSWPM